MTVDRTGRNRGADTKIVYEDRRLPLTEVEQGDPADVRHDQEQQRNVQHGNRAETDVVRRPLGVVFRGQRDDPHGLRAARARARSR